MEDMHIRRTEALNQDRREGGEKKQTEITGEASAMETRARSDNYDIVDLEYVTSYPPIPGNKLQNTESIDRMGNSGDRVVNTGDRMVNSGDRMVNSGDRMVNSGDRMVNSGDRMVNSGDRMVNSGDRMVNSGDRVVNSRDGLETDQSKSSPEQSHPLTTRQISLLQSDSSEDTLECPNCGRTFDMNKGEEFLQHTEGCI